ncbi:synaptic vesicular amine transporter [Episyrphus balteatus]|uniref:synaptic vesicular amine transporter n=1 Tax=Episyrphus balteatus TaxID=286459 RepID=UPI002486B83B|nr:synaptic vesicular amine transporter [Episyrphus balteatus]
MESGKPEDEQSEIINSQVHPPSIGQSRTVIATIVYLALLVDNILLTVIVPILPDYLATINNKSLLDISETNQQQLLIQNLAYRNLDSHHAPVAIMTKHPIPGKSLVNFTVVEDKVIIAPVVGDGSSSLLSENNENDTLASENGSIGILLAMKALVQLIFNPIVGGMSSKFGYRLPIVFGTFCLLISALVFAIGETYVTLLIARSVQGVGSACIGVCGMSLVAQLYPEEDKRSKVMGIILGSIALGVLLGYPFGSILYDLVGKSSPFIILSTLIFLNLGMQLLTMDLSVQPEVTLEAGQPKWRPIFESKMILAIVVAILVSTSSMAILEPCLPIWLMEHLRPYKWQLGTVFIPDSVGYFIGTNFFGTVAYNFGQIKVSCLSLLLVGIASILIPSATTVPQLLLPHFCLGLGIGIIDAALVPLLASFVDISLGDDQVPAKDLMSSYGTVYAIQQTSVSLAYCLAPLLGGELVQAMGFTWLMRLVGLCNIVYGPLLVLLYNKYNPKFTAEKDNQMLLDTSGNGPGSHYKKLYNSVE